VTIAKGQAWGAPGSLPSDGVVVRSDAEARRVFEEARRLGRPFPTLGLLAGDLCHTVGGPGDEPRLHSSHAMRLPIDVGEVTIDGRLALFVAHLVAHSRDWRRSFVAMNAQWRGPWNLGPRAHPNDGLLDTYDSHLGPKDLFLVRRRLHHGAHLPHPGIKERRTTAIQVDLGRSLLIELDGQPVGRGRRLTLRADPDAAFVVV